MQVYEESINEYRFFVNSNRAYIKLFSICTLLFFLLAFIWIILLKQNLLENESRFLVGILVLAIPFMVFEFFKKLAADEYVAKFTDDGVEFLLEDKYTLIKFNEIKKYYIHSDFDSEDDNKVVLKIKLNNGKRITFRSKSNVCDVTLLRDFCHDFEIIANQHQIQNKFFLF